MKKFLTALSVFLFVLTNFALAQTEQATTGANNNMPVVRFVFMVIAAIILIASLIVTYKAVGRYKQLKAQENSIKDKSKG